MQILKDKQALNTLVESLKKEGKSIGFVPTMGALHQGHLSLMKSAMQSCDRVVVSIFVNPTQFNNPQDLEKYPRTLDRDLELIAGLSSDFVVFTPQPQDIYGTEITSENFSFDGLEYEMEGKFRQGHFNGVGTVVKKLFEIVQPDKAFFGEKDYQQLRIVRKLVEKLKMPIDIVGCPIDREASGLARSSRNERLSSFQRQNAALIYKVLLEVKQDFGTKSASEITDWVESKFRENEELKLEYFEIASEETLKSIQQKEKGQKYRAFIAAYSGEIRLIDNLALN